MTPITKHIKQHKHVDLRERKKTQNEHVIEVKGHKTQAHRHTDKENERNNMQVATKELRVNNMLLKT